MRTLDAKGRLLADHVKADWAIGPVMIPPPPGSGHAAAATPPPSRPRPESEGQGRCRRANTTAENGPPQGGAIVATVDAGGKKMTGFTRVRVMPNLPWSFDFESSARRQAAAHLA